MAKIFIIGNTLVTAGADATSDLGSSSIQWKDLWVTGTAYIDAVGENLPVLGTFRVSWGSAATSYIHSSADGYLAIAAGTQIDILANIGVTTGTGITIAMTTNSRLGFFGATPVVQQTGDIITALATLGLVTNGSIAGVTPTITTTSTTYSILTSDEYVICNSGTSFDVTLPVAGGVYQEVMVKNIGAGTVGVLVNGIDSIDNVSSITLDQWEFTKVLDFAPASGIDGYSKLMLHFEGVDASTTFTDSSPDGRTVTAVGDAQIDTAEFKYGSASGLFDDTGDYLTVPDAAIWDLGTVHWTISAFVRIAAVGDNMICSRVDGGSSYFYFGLESTVLRLRDFTGSNNFDMQRSVSIATATWYHIAAVRFGNVFSLYVDGALQGVTSTAAVTFTARTSVLTIGHMTENAGYGLNGWMDELHVSIGTARWTTDFTPPTAAESSVPGKWLTIT